MGTSCQKTGALEECSQDSNTSEVSADSNEDQSNAGAAPEHRVRGQKRPKIKNRSRGTKRRRRRECCSRRRRGRSRHVYNDEMFGAWSHMGLMWHPGMPWAPCGPGFPCPEESFRHRKDYVEDQMRRHEEREKRLKDQREE